MAIYWTDKNGRKWLVTADMGAWLTAYENEALRRTKAGMSGYITRCLDLYQTIGGAAASGGTHLQVNGKACCIDTAQTSVEMVSLARQMGADATWHRKLNWDGRGGMPHCHINLRGIVNKYANYQYSSTAYGVDHGHNGLANGAKDDGPKPLSKRTWSEGIAWAKAQAAAAKPNVLKTTAGITVNADGTATLNISATKACSGWVQIWDDEKGVHVSSVHYYKFAKAGWQPLKFTGVPVLNTAKALARVKQEKPVDGANPQWNPLTLKTAAAPVVPPKPMTLRPMTQNLPDEVKIPNAAKRIVAGVAVAKKANPDFVGGQEWVGRKADGSASDHAAAIHKAWGAGYSLLIPTLPLNENYAILKDAAVTLVKQYPDKVIGSRHLTLAVCKDVASGRSFLFGNSQFVNNDHPLAQAEGVLAMAELKRVAALEGGLPIVVLGDFNTPDDIAAFAKAGLINCRKHAAASTGEEYATYTNQAKTTPSTNVADWTIDQIWVSPEFVVDGYTQVMDLDASGKFRQPRGSDHVPVIAAIHTK